MPAAGVFGAERPDLALLKALGFDERQLSSAIAWQATVATVTGYWLGAMKEKNGSCANVLNALSPPLSKQYGPRAPAESQ
jgi:hypothetical protein